jgi:hypothetical protein
MSKYKRYEEGMVAYRTRSHTGWHNYRGWQLHINQGWRDAELLAKDGHDFLFEYEMPNGRNYLHQVSIGRDGKFEPVGRSINRRRLPLKWQMVEWLEERSR